jgi:hypothetical protein
MKGIISALSSEIFKNNKVKNVVLHRYSTTSVDKFEILQELDIPLVHLTLDVAARFVARIGLL